jgi:predicted amidohydrolase
MNFNITVLQFLPVRRDVAENIRRIQALLSGVKSDLVVLPELANSGYLYKSPETLLPYAEPSNGRGEFLKALKALAGAIGGVIVAGYAERDQSNLFNSAIAVSPQGVIENYRKTHLYADEKQLFLPGNTGFRCSNWQNIRIGMMVCFDWIFPESARTLALAGAQIIAHPANLVLPYCQDAMVTRAIENRVFTITANRIGQEELGGKTLSFTGQSQMTDTFGKILYRASENNATVHHATIDPEEAQNKWISDSNNLFKDRRPDEYNFRK